MRINPFLYGVMVLGIFLGVIYGFRSAGVWSISGKVDAKGNQIAPSAADVETIKGWMTLGEIAAAFDVPLAEILAQFQLPDDTPAETAVKDLESETFSVSGLRDWLQARQAVEATPQPAAPAQPTPSLSPAPAAETQTAPAEGQPAAPQGAGSASTEADHTPNADRRVNAKTTFQNLLDWGVPVEVIRQIIGADLPDPSTVVKDYITAQGKEFSSVRSALQAEVDKIVPTP